MALIDVERAVYENVWQLDKYHNHSPGQQNVPLFMGSAFDFLKKEYLATSWKASEYSVLDAGCGAGAGALALSNEGFKVKMIDVTDAGLTPDAKQLPFEKASLWDDLHMVARGFRHPGAQTFDFVYCCDVLEHIPPQFTMLAISRMIQVARYGVFLSISLVQDNMGAWVGESLHKTVKSYTWWRDSIRELGIVHDARDLHHYAVLFVGPK